MTAPFDARDEGTIEKAWTESWLGGLPELAAPPPGSNVLVVAAHPDDETLGAGGLIAQCAASGVAVTVIVATDGEASHPASPTHSPSRLASRRRGEVAEAVHILHPGAQLVRLGLPDGRLAAHHDAVSAAIAAHAATATLIVTPWAGDRHPDHEECGRAGAAVAAERGLGHWQYPVWAWHWGTPGAVDAASFARLSLDSQTRAAKRRALAAHTSQHRALSPASGDEPVLTATMLSHFDRDVEVFAADGGRADAPASEAAYFDALYRAAEDPWGLSDRFYERRKRALLIASLPKPRFRRTFEPGRATGLITKELANRSDTVVAWDGARAAVDQTTRRLAGEIANGRVRVERALIPQQWPPRAFDLIVVSEVGYFCPDQALLRTRVERSLTADGVLVACHWRHPAADHPVGAEEVHAGLGRGLHSLAAHREADFLLDVWTRDGVSVAAATGVL